jgi:hypothetical protein
MLHGLRGSYWILPPSLYEVIDRTDLLVGSAGIASTPRLQALVLALVGMAVLAGAAALAVRGRWRVALLLSAATVLPIAGAVATSFAIMPIFIPRILVWIQLSAALLVASALLWLPSGSVRTLGAAALAGMVAALSAGYPFAREPWREIVELLAARTTTQDLIVVWPNSVHFPLLYYGGHQRVPAAYLRLWDGTGDYPTPYQAFSFTGQQSPSIQELLERLRHHTAENDGNVWLVTRAGLQTEVVAGIDRLLESQRGAPMTEVTFVIPGGLDPPVRVVRYPPKQHK